MRIITIIGMILFLANVFCVMAVREGAGGKIKEQGLKSVRVYPLLYARLDALLIAQNDHAGASEQEPPDHAEEEKQRKTKQENDSPEQEEDEPALKDFEPSEKIDAEKAVDFPSDI